MIIKAKFFFFVPKPLRSTGSKPVTLLIFIVELISVVHLLIALFSGSRYFPIDQLAPCSY